MSLISIIVPVYNVEQYLEQCITSITAQTYTNLEIILVDDGSTDKCPNICDEWAKKDDRIKVIHKTNGGLSDARNAGMRIATGEYIAFVDSDDRIHNKFIELLFTALKNNNSYLAACDVAFVKNHDETHALAESACISVNDTEKALNTLIHGNGFRAVVWNKLYHRDLLNNESFKIGRYHEDEFFTYRIIAKVKNPVYVNAKLYYYLQRENSIVNSISFKHLDALDAYFERLLFLKNQFPKLYHYDKLSFCKACINLYQSVSDFPADIKNDCTKKIKIIRRKINFSLPELCSYSFSDIIYILCSSNAFIGCFCKLKTFGKG